MAELILTIDEEDKKIFLEGLKNSGLSPAQFFKSLLQNIINPENKEWKFNDKTIKAIEELENGLGQTFEAASVEEFMKSCC